ncbi:MAG: SDR family NAD(P)-dependent oxidoreductase [Burkholderiaceae bacterium]|nr:SDR family NAD(P)-dependent oxidoreductase [Microbacteriaceae bacterium]
MSSKPAALITGATSGIGAEFARQLAAQGHDLVLVARTASRLEEVAVRLRTVYGVCVECIAADLGSAEALAGVERTVATSAPGILVNNAGFGLRKPFDENPVALEQQHLDVLVTAPMRLSHAALGPMLARGSGVIITVSSVAGFTPRGSYGAAKAWALSFSRWANIQYRPRGVTVMALAPGFVRTEFHERMKVGTGNIPRFLWLTPERVVRVALRDAARGRAVSIPTKRYQLIVAVSRVLPARVVAAGALRGR